MKTRVVEYLVAALLLTGSISTGWAAEHGSAITGTPEWDRIKSLVGEWDGYVMEGDE